MRRSNTSGVQSAFHQASRWDGGDRIAILNGHVVRNGVQEPDPYIEPCGSDSSCNFAKPIVVRLGDYFTLGDNRGASDDSRFWGPVPGGWIVGTMVH